MKCTVLGALFEFLCGYLGEHLLEVTFWDYSAMPLHIGKYINLPFCLVWGGIDVAWVWKIYPSDQEKTGNSGSDRTEHRNESISGVHGLFSGSHRGGAAKNA